MNWKEMNQDKIYDEEMKYEGLSDVEEANVIHQKPLEKNPEIESDIVPITAEGKTSTPDQEEQNVMEHEPSSQIK